METLIAYDITEDVLNRKADINVKDLLIAAPGLKKDLVKSVRKKTKRTDPTSLTLAFAEDDDVDTTAIYTEVYIGQFKIKAILDTGSDKTVISKKLADILELNIRTPSNSVFTLENGTKQAALGLIYDVPINLGGKLIVPGSIEVLPVCPTQLIIGNNRLKRAKAKMNLEEKVVKIEYKGDKVHVPFVFTKDHDNITNLKSQTTKYTYADQINTVQSTPIGLVNPIVDNDTGEESDSDVSEKSDESDELLPESSDEESVTDLYILEDTYGETRKINHKKDIISMENNPELSDNYLIKLQSAIYLSPYSKTSFTIKPMNLSVSQMEETKFMLFITNDKLHDRDSTWQPASSYLKHNQDVLTIYLISNSDSTIELSAQETIGELDPTEEDFFHIEEVHDPSQGTMIEYEEKLSNKIDLTNVPAKTKQAYVKMMYNFDHIFDWNNDKIGNIDIMEHTIKLKSDAIPKRSEVMNYPLSNIDDLPDNLSKAHWMSTFDLRSGFFQANISRESKPLTTVVCSLGDFYFKKLPTGIKTSPSIFSQMMEQCLHELINDCIIIYLDDVTCFTNVENPEQHLLDLRKTFTCMANHGIVLNPAKCHFFQKRILFLGYVVTRNTIEPNPDTITKIILGLASYYRRFVPQFAKIARPLHQQLQTTKKIAWTSETTAAFTKLKELLVSEPVLCKPDFVKKFYVVTDASKDGLGAVLTQKDDEGHEHPIIYSSRLLHGAEVNYGISKLELLAVVWAVKLYRPYLLGSKFTVTIISDHSALNGLLKTKQPSGILARWIKILSEYDFEIKYRPGRVN
ncbi:hypothetical protein INT47_006654 [Mucor saturninus]|uniref:Reverse transcriptase n=1 Tax=Mucor saturninus TaxID=64648 RepID=A0A8H7QG24_9FUNG|nr:hypothetical protein INT47_006654 [Mucor saturninus]